MTKRTPTPASTNETKRCAIYTRKSTTMGLEQEFNSLDAQRESGLAYIQRQPGWTLVDERYDDGGFTGANSDRPAFQRLIADVEAGKVDVIVVYKVDRLSRSLLDFAKMMERFNAAGASFVSVTQNFSTADAMGRLTLNMLMSFAEFERSMIAERTRDKIAASRRKGKWTGGPVPFGYDAKDKKLLINEVEAHTVREAFTLFLQHRQMAMVARTLMDRGLLPRGSSRPAKRGLRWTKDAIARVLKNPLYAGYMMYGAELYPGEHPPLISEPTFQQAKRILAGAERDLRFNGTNLDYVLRGLLRCGLCRDAMCPGSTTKGSKIYRYYRCSERDNHGEKACPAKPLPAGAIEDFVAQRISAATADGTLATHVAAALEQRIAARRKALLAIRAELPGRVASAATTGSKYTEELSKFEGRARELVEAKLRAATDTLVAAERQLAETERDTLDLDVAVNEAAWIVGALGNFAKVWKMMTPENQGRLLRALVAEVRVQEATGVVEVELMNFAADPSAKEAA
jgi:site-specific DNA recombinase